MDESLRSNFIVTDSNGRLRRRRRRSRCSGSVRSNGFFRRCRFGSQFRLIFDIINQNLLLFTFTPRAKLLVRPNSLPVLYLYVPSVGQQSNRLPSPLLGVMYIFFSLITRHRQYEFHYYSFRRENNIYI